jgi:hypothetical protein
MWQSENIVKNAKFNQIWLKIGKKTENWAKTALKA